MKPPRTIKVGPHDYTIRPERRDGDDFAETHTDRCEIIVSGKQCQSQLRDTILHEIFHACSDLAGLRFEMGEENDERYARRMAPVFLDVLRRNPRLVEFLVER